VLFSATAALFSSTAWAQTTIKIVMPVPAGGADDIVARTLTEQVGRTQGVTLVVENRPGAGTIIGTEAVARAAPDGSTLLITAPSLVIAPHLRKTSFDALTAFEPICYLPWKAMRTRHGSPKHTPWNKGKHQLGPARIG
jgi:tripartite-type tricarboxylate transporter receptor subunit TctC